MTMVEHARSWLFVPGSRPGRFDKAVASGTDVVILDLEDAVGDDAKAVAREHAATWLGSGGRAAVRVNAIDSVHHAADLDALAGLAGLVAVVVPMAESAPGLAAVHDRLGPLVPIVPQVETAVGLARLAGLAGSPGVARLTVGHLDLALDLDASPDSDTVVLARAGVVLASRVAGLPGPVDSVTTALDDESAVRRDAAAARALGFTGKLCIHPRQVAPVREEMGPTPADVAWATTVLDGATEGAVRVGGQMVDAPVLARARRVLAAARPNLTPERTDD